MPEIIRPRIPSAPSGALVRWSLSFRKRSRSDF